MARKPGGEGRVKSHTSGMMRDMVDKSDAEPTSPSPRAIPSVDSLLNHPAIATLSDEFPRQEIVLAIRRVLDDRRAEILAGGTPELAVPSLALDVRQELYRRTRPNLRAVINATGVVLHTGLGRAPLAREAVEAITDVAAGYCNLELDLANGKRGDRHDHLRELLRELTGAEDAMVVNNNAGATFLALSALSCGRSAVVSRGQLVEIGGSYRMPDIMAAAGCRMVEVGTTNRTHIADYERALDDQTAVIVRVHTSNYRIEGFVTTPALEELVALARRFPEQNIAVVDDLGSGLMDASLAAPREVPSEEDGRAASRLAADWDEPTVRESVAAGADLTLFSGDKLLGGPQAGIIIGRQEMIAKLRASPLARALRPDKMTLAGLEATLRLYRDPDSLAERLPVLRMLTADDAAVAGRARRLARLIADAVPDSDVQERPDSSFAGGGTLPTLPFPTHTVRFQHESVGAGDIAAALRARDIPIIARLSDDVLVFDCRTLSDDEIDRIPSSLCDAIRDIEESA